jgi:predicted enzyme related to lactoylglutathione lyase
MEYWLVSTGKEGPGIDGGLLKRPGPEALTVNTLQVESVDAAAESVIANGGTVVVPKMAIPGIGWLVYCKDTEGIIFGMMHPDASAA